MGHPLSHTQTQSLATSTLERHRSDTVSRYSVSPIIPKQNAGIVQAAVYGIAHLVVTPEPYIYIVYVNESEILNPKLSIK